MCVLCYGVSNKRLNPLRRENGYPFMAKRRDHENGRAFAYLTVLRIPPQTTVLFCGRMISAPYDYID